MASTPKSTIPATETTTTTTPIRDVSLAMQAVHERATETNTPQSYYVVLTVWPHQGVEIHWNPTTRSLHWANIQINSIPTVPNDGDDTGYTLYQQSHNKASQKENDAMTKLQWDQNFTAAVISINNAVRLLHGVSCQTTVDNKRYTKILHICDFITIMIGQTGHHPPPNDRDGTQANHWTSTPNNHVINQADLRFILANADYFFLCYGLWQNNSRLPITYRPTSQLMPNAATVMSDPDFQRVQRGKTMALTFDFYHTPTALNAYNVM